MKTNKYISAALIVVTVLTFGCKKSYLDTSPSNAITDENLYTTTTSCFQVIDGIGRLMNTTGASYLPLGGTTRANDFGESTIRFAEDHMGNDMVDGTNGYDWFVYYYNFQGIRQPTYNVAQHPWRLYYKIINSANLLLDNVDKATGPVTETQYLKGEAYAYRAYSYYKLSLYYCKTYSYHDGLGLPIYLHGTTDTTKGHARTASVDEVYTQIQSDLDSARVYLEASASSVNSGRPISDISLATFYGIAAKVALVKEDWKTASDFADLAITTSGKRLMNSSEYLTGFNDASNPEWMWASVITESQRTSMGNINFMSFVDPSNSTSYANTGLTTSLCKNTYDRISTADVRYKVFTAGTRVQTKFHLANPLSWNFDALYMRLSEMYLIKAEALANQGLNDDAIAVLESLVQTRFPLYEYANKLTRLSCSKTGVFDGTLYPINTGTVTTPAKSELLAEIYMQRRVELFLEGVAYSDIQRWKTGLLRPSGTGNFTVGTAVKLKLNNGDNTFQFKIPQQEMDSNPAMAGQQNP